MNYSWLKQPSNRRFAAITLALFLVLAIQIAVYAAGMKSGAEVATYCAKEHADNPGLISPCIFGGCFALHPNDMKKRKQCMRNANQQLKK